MMVKRKKILLTTVTFTLLTFITACTDLTSVREWSGTSLEATQYNELITTYANTPERLKRYDSSPQWDEQIASRKNQAEALKLLLEVVSDYMSVLAILSSDNIVDYSKDTETLKKNLVKLNKNTASGSKQISMKTIGAAGSLVKTMLNATTKACQSRKITNIIEHANEPLQKIIGPQGDLFQIVDNDFRRDLKTEKIKINAFYKNLSRSGNPSSAAKEAVAEWQEMRLGQNEKRLNAVDAYLETLRKIAIGHQKIYDNRDSLDSKDLVKQLRTLSAELRKQIKILSQS
ncbi:MAG TPA: hypothetical protein ENJ08_03720 [Gammaproteobacteria bacterium]|nr:hypothetical protein [Gammaproteobacteria bacterium]